MKYCIRFMSSRNYFTRRDAIPGFTFLIIILVMNYTPLLNVIHYLPIQPLVGAVLGFLTIMSGSAIGFHVSQLWWSWYQWRNAHYDRRPYQTLIKEYDLTRCKDKESIKAVIAVYGYFFHKVLGCKEKSELVKYCQRRFDLFHTFSATIFSIILGLFFGIGYRIIFAVQWNYTYDLTKEPFFHVIVTIVCFILIYLLKKGNDWILFQYDSVSVAIIKDKDNKIINIRDLFPDEYFRATCVAKKKPQEIHQDLEKNLI